MSSPIPVQLKEFYVFNPDFGNDHDDEMGKVMYYFPHATDENTQLKRIGLCQGIIQFTEMFNCDIPCEALHTMKSRYIFHNPEGSYYFVMVLSIPSVEKTSPEGIEITEYQNDQVQDNVFQSLLAKMYEKFVLLNGRLVNIEKIDLKRRLEKFIDLALNKLEPNHCGIAEIFRGLQFFPLGREPFLRVHCAINHLLMTFPSVKHLLLMQSDKLIWTGLAQKHIQIFYDYVRNDLLSSHFLSGADKQSTFGIIYKRDSHIHLNLSDDVEDEAISLFHLVIYKAEASYFVMLLDSEEEETLRIEAFLNVNFITLAKELTKEGVLPEPSPIKYVYFNNLNFAEKMSPGCLANMESYKLLADLKQDISRMTENGEIILKMISDVWIVAKVSNKREFYAIFNQKGSICEIDEEIRKLSDVHLTNIFFQD